jgi:hypothetical protein
MKYRINEIKYKGKTMYEPQVGRLVRKWNPEGQQIEQYELWDNLSSYNGVVCGGGVHLETYYSSLPTTIEAAEKIIETYHEKLQQPTEPIIKTIKEYELPKIQTPEEKEIPSEEQTRLEKLEALAKLVACHIGSRPDPDLPWEEVAAMMLYEINLWPLTIDEIVEQTRAHIRYHSKVTAMMDAAGGSKIFWEAKYQEGKKK